MDKKEKTALTMGSIVGLALLLLLRRRAGAEPEPEPEPNTVLIAGRVMNTDGDGLGWADIFIYAPNDVRYETKADADGYYSYDLGDLPGDYHIVAAAIGEPRYELGTQDLTLYYGSNEVDFYLQLWEE